jgi:predicted nucleotidyltransferase
VDGTADQSSDIDLAVSGLSPRAYFKTVAEISSIVGWKVDLVTMDHVSKDFKKKIQKHGKRLYAA